MPHPNNIHFFTLLHHLWLLVPMLKRRGWGVKRFWVHAKRGSRLSSAWRRELSQEDEWIMISFYPLIFFLCIFISIWTRTQHNISIHSVTLPEQVGPGRGRDVPRAPGALAGQCERSMLSDADSADKCAFHMSSKSPTAICRMLPNTLSQALYSKKLQWRFFTEPSILPTTQINIHILPLWTHTTYLEFWNNSELR